MAVISIVSLGDTVQMNDDMFNKTVTPIRLPSKVIFDNVGEEMKKPEFVDSGLKINTLDSGESAKGNSTIPIIADQPNSYNKNGYAMENSGYFIIPRSVTSDPRYKSARLKYKHILNTLFEKVAFAPTTHAVGTHLIKIEIGQYCIAVRSFADLCNEGVKHEEDKVDRNTISRAILYFEKCQFVRQEVRHGKSILTITVPEFYERNKKTTETTSEPRPRQDRDTKEEYKEDKEDNISSGKGSFEPSPFATSLLSEFYSSLFLAIPDFPKQSAKKTKTQYEAADAIGTKAKNDMELIKKVIAYAHMKGGFWLAHVHSVSYLNKKFSTLVEQLRTQGKKPMNGQKPDSLHNKSFTKDTKPKTYNNTYDFSKPRETPK